MLEIRRQLKRNWVSVGFTRASLMILFHKEKAKRRTIASRMRPEMSLLSWRSFLFGPTIGSLSKLAAAEPLSPRSLQWQLLVTATATNQIPRNFRHKIFIFWRIFYQDKICQSSNPSPWQLPAYMQGSWLGETMRPLAFCMTVLCPHACGLHRESLSLHKVTSTNYFNHNGNYLLNINRWRSWKWS